MPQHKYLPSQTCEISLHPICRHNDILLDGGSPNKPEEEEEDDLNPNFSKPTNNIIGLAIKMMIMVNLALFLLIYIAFFASCDKIVY